MEITDFSIGTDIEEINRFENKTLEKDEKFLKRIFTKSELEYCFSDSQVKSHLAARYCAKEAAVKALYALGIEEIFYNDIEIVNNKNKVPELIIKKYPNIKTKVSLSHSKTTAAATVILYKEI